MNRLHLLNHPWHQLKFLSVSPLAQLVAPEEGFAVASLLARVGVFRSWGPGAGKSDRLPHLRAYLAMPGRGPRSRFSDGTFRVVYGGKTRATCLAEVTFHHGQALQDSGEPAGAARIFEALTLRVGGAFVALRKGHSALLGEDYNRPQAFGARCRSQGEPGLVYPSVRHREGECLALFDGQRALACELEEVVALRWDGERLG